MIIISAYELYVDPKSDEPEESRAVAVGSNSQTFDATGARSNKPVTKAERFKKAFSHEGVKVHFVGVWCVMLVLPLRYSMLTTTLGILFHLLALCVESTCSPGQSMG